MKKSEILRSNKDIIKQYIANNEEYPRLITNSTGRTSGYMAIREHEKGLGPHDYIIFTNTGHEDEESLKFLHKQQLAGLPVRWLEYDPWTQWKEVDFHTASRYDPKSTHASTPFEKLVGKRTYVPNVATRYCTEILKIRVQRDFMRSMGYNSWSKLVGLRYDEPSRYYKMKQSNKRERWDVGCPLFEDRIVEADVLDFWRKQPFDLQLMRHQGNCTFCFLKRETRLIELMRHGKPDELDFWLQAEKATNTTFIERKPYRALHHIAQSQTQLDFYPEGLLPTVNSCFCGD